MHCNFVLDAPRDKRLSRKLDVSRSIVDVNKYLNCDSAVESKDQSIILLGRHRQQRRRYAPPIIAMANQPPGSAPQQRHRYAPPIIAMAIQPPGSAPQRPYLYENNNGSNNNNSNGVVQQLYLNEQESDRRELDCPIE
jgi:hypothetical protein